MAVQELRRPALFEDEEGRHVEGGLSLHLRLRLGFLGHHGQSSVSSAATVAAAAMTHFSSDLTCLAGSKIARINDS